MPPTPDPNLSSASAPPDPSVDRMPVLIARYTSDRELLERLYAAPFSRRRLDRLRSFFAEWRETNDALPFDDFSRSGRADWLLFRNLLDAERRRLDREARRFAELEPLLPFASSLVDLDEERRRMEEIDPEAAAERLDRAAREIGALMEKIDAGIALEGMETRPHPSVGNRAATALDRTREILRGWFDFYRGYDPVFTWWAEKPYQTLDRRLEEYSAFLRKRLAGVEDADAIVGDPIGRDALVEEIDRALVAYTPEELIDIARREKEWCESELVRAAREMGCGGDWRAAIERVKADHVPPGAQPVLVRDLAREAIRYVEERDLVTVPPLAREGWRMEMMSPERQKVNPFFLGGETIAVSFPTSAMEHDRKRMSLRGNNRHFARATVHHELIPGHWLQAFHQERYRPYRQAFYTPFWVEGWALHWEMLLWELGFPRTPEERIGMLFWRMHRCARVLFSLGFHLREMTPGECVEMLVNDVGHERENAAAEVRRSFGGDYDPLYQCAYLIGGMQVHALHREIAGSGRMTHREFHDAVLRENAMPIEILRALLSGLPLERDFGASWRFDSISNP